ncbi:MAG: hypothetical protein JRD05_02870 [Deltaproteobacteria bacterium]|nr:hypothetical protein [Deltaproteobacteria bacterium]
MGENHFNKSGMPSFSKVSLSLQPLNCSLYFHHMYLSAFLHRTEFFEITNRWLSDRLEPEDPLKITRIITYDSFAAWETLLLFINDLLKSLTNLPFKKTSISHKKVLKDFLCNNSHPKSDRIKSLISEYMEMPEFYYVGSPITGYIYHDRLINLLSICRFKRTRRIAEKASRYASMHVYNEVKALAKDISKKRTKRKNHNELLLHNDYIEAEKQIMSRVRKNGIKFPVASMTINDILGTKIIDNGYGENKLESLLTRLPGVSIIEKKKHSGSYNAVHYIIELKVNFDYITDKFKKIAHTNILLKADCRMPTYMKTLPGSL